MKHFISVSLSFLFVSAAFAQQLKTDYYANGTKRSEGILLGVEKEALAPDFDKQPKEIQLQRSANGYKDGKWTFWHENGKVSAEQYYNKGEMTGVWKSWTQDGAQGSEIDFNKGTAVYWYANGKKSSEGKIIKGMQHDGAWTGWYENGNINYEGNYKQGLKEGTWTWYNNKGVKIQEEIYKNGLLISSTKL
jgi:antitoxin component YwqK of YwqJK toxin-antitoxin module